MAIWRLLLAIWLIVSAVIWFVGPTFAYAFVLIGVVAVVAGISILLASRTERT